jgi:hypothetical protein
MFDWQTIIVALLILGALVYVGRRGLTRVRSLYATKAGANTCDTGCGKCEASQSQPAASLKTLVQLERSPRRSIR